MENMQNRLKTLNRDVTVAIHDQDRDALREAIKDGADVDSLADIHTPLFYAVQNGWVDGVDILLAAGADVNLISPIEGDTPLMGAVRENNYTILERLLEANADITIQNMKTDADLKPTALDLANMLGYENIRLKLVQHINVSEKVQELLAQHNINQLADVPYVHPESSVLGRPTGTWIGLIRSHKANLDVLRKAIAHDYYINIWTKTEADGASLIILTKPKDARFDITLYLSERASKYTAYSGGR